MNGHNGQSVAEVYQDFIFAKTAEGVSDITIRNYHQHLPLQFSVSIAHQKEREKAEVTKFP